MSAIFSGCYQQFDEVPSADNYNGLNITQRIYDAARTRYELSTFFPEPITNEYNHIRDITSLCITMLCAETSKTIHVLDVGGGFGVSFVELLKRTQLNNFHYTVCEIKNFVDYYKANPIFKEKNISILESITEASRQYELLILGSSLQYFPNTAEAIQQLVVSAQNPNYILLTHTPVTQNASFVTAQVNMDQKNIPNWIFNVNSLISIFKQNHYQCIYKSAIYREHLFDDFEGAEERYRSANLLFKKK
jgi:putative methyltransferase (TIGR04325 family)